MADLIGMKLGICKNCKSEVELRQPWLSEQPLVDDGFYLAHCKNENCQNHYGVELNFDLDSYDLCIMLLEFAVLYPGVLKQLHQIKRRTDRKIISFGRLRTKKLSRCHPKGVRHDYSC